MKKRALGRNLDVLLSRPAQAASVAEVQQVMANKNEGELRHLPLDILQRGRYQPRREINPEAIRELADSIRKQGIIQPIVVRSVGQNRYEIIAGERRWRAAQQAGLQQIPALVKQISDEAALAVALIENIQRQDLNALEEAIALQRLAEEFDMTHQQIAEAVGKSRTMVSNLLRLLSLQPEVKRLLEQNKIEMGHARTLLPLSANLQVEAARTVVAKNLSVRETENLVNQLQQPPKVLETLSSHRMLDSDVRVLQKDLSERLGAKVQIRHNVKGKGKLFIHYNNLDELDGILARIQ
jgi:ParB family transcriptional regulator, chromosome partitioning protein